MSVAVGSKRARRRHVQQALFRRGGKRKGAGRKAMKARAGTSHDARPCVDGKQALHVVLRVVPEIGNLRRPEMYRAVQEATVVAALRERIRIIQLSVQATHIHLVLEVDNKQALARGMQGFQISVARNLNTVLGDGRRRRRGRVFADRYHLTVVRSPTQARNVLAYVMNNWRKHREDQSGAASTALVDRFSSGISFPDWREREDEPWMWRVPEDHEPLLVYRPRSWLLREGWKRAGTISAREVPSKIRTAAR
jgi:REP element-mobilizing transposase RayT